MIQNKIKILMFSLNSKVNIFKILYKKMKILNLYKIK